MILQITDANAWESEKWSYVLDVNKQSAAALNYLMIFQRVANKMYEDMKEAAPLPPPSSFPFVRRMKLFAASRYSIEFWDAISREEDRWVLHQKEGRRRTSMSIWDKGGGYKNSLVLLEAKISPAKMYSAMVSIRDKKENKLYKNFEFVFYKKNLVIPA